MAVDQRASLEARLERRTEWWLYKLRGEAPPQRPASAAGA